MLHLRSSALHPLSSGNHCFLYMLMTDKVQERRQQRTATATCRNMRREDVSGTRTA